MKIKEQLKILHAFKEGKKIQRMPSVYVARWRRVRYKNQ